MSSNNPDGFAAFLIRKSRSTIDSRLGFLLGPLDFDDSVDITLNSCMTSVVCPLTLMYSIVFSKSTFYGASASLLCSHLMPLNSKGARSDANINQ